VNHVASTANQAVSASTVWTAPTTDGTYVLILQVTDSKGASSGVSLSVTVSG
jgi:hypothetical protein